MTESLGWKHPTLQAAGKGVLVFLRADFARRISLFPGIFDEERFFASLRMTALGSFSASRLVGGSGPSGPRETIPDPKIVIPTRATALAVTRRRDLLLGLPLELLGFHC
jgi:hypothetical protein